MLVLSRFEREQIRIQTSDGPIVVKLLRLFTTKVQLGIEAPEACKIVRDELSPQPVATNQDAA